ncbi:uncharacterized protein K452DRAFT_254307 [Aplosporella prunicola CBS 121167]|uniref:TMEM205-like domain-containing protein n=1 Tax=Aplosporella prunicola CBS 121167 TaxID=1176127 RepID=A0A6A6BA00_9PEZI|nr:uncharacterized protein K452DRAFT_254307 [Aplosporella prunicola CBS 121167]KAF2139737.1 hypothetical protein K452DRAFT_254307 [Aplosporella prunicola CBS 121167]
MPLLASLKTGAPYHLLSYGTLLGSTLFQSFIAGPLAFRALPRPQFATLQSSVFPVYFILQTSLSFILALTFPAPRSPLTASTIPVGALPHQHLASTSTGGFSGLLQPTNRAALVQLGLIFITSLANLTLVGPATTRTMRERKHQETRDGVRAYDAGPQSPEMVRLNRRFGILHGVSSLANLVGFLAVVGYGVGLSERL